MFSSLCLYVSFSVSYNNTFHWIQVHSKAGLSQFGFLTLIALRYLFQIRSYSEVSVGVGFGSHNAKPNSVTQMLLGLGPGYLVHILARRGI